MTKREKGHDEVPAEIEDHPFVPRGQWWSLCEVCGLAQAAHHETTVDTLEEIRRDQERQEEWRQAELARSGRARIGYYSDDNPDD